MTNENKMGTMPVGKLMISMSWPAMLSMLIQALYNVVDSMFVAKLSESALAAVTLTYPIHMMLISIGVGTGIGINSLIARRLGAKRIEEANSAASHGFRLAFINWLLFAIFGLFFAKTYMELYSSSEYMLTEGAGYMKIITIFSLFLIVQITIEKILQATGNMMIPMLCSLTGAVINIVLDPLLIFGIGVFPKMGLIGAAIATVFGQFCAMSMGLAMVFGGKKHILKIQIKEFKWQLETIKDIYGVALPSMLMQSITSILLFFINGMLSVSETAVAVLGSYFRLQSFIFLPVIGLNQGAMPILGYNFGAKNKARLIETFKIALGIAVAIMATGTFFFMVIPNKLLMLFSASDSMLEIGIPALRILSLCFVFAAFGIMTSTLFQATGHGMLSMWQSLIRQLIGILPLAWLFIRIWGISMVWWAWVLAEFMGFAYCVIFLNRLYHKEIKVLDLDI